MSYELSPTKEHLLDPYVLQLIEALSHQQDRIEELEEGSCRYNCTTKSAMWKAGYRSCSLFPAMVTDEFLELLYQNWRKENG